MIIAHSWPLGFGLGSPGHLLSSGQTDVGALSLYGFFLISGFLITESGMRSSLRQYLWARILRVFPGLWVCLLVTAFGFAPLVAFLENGSLDGFWEHPGGPVDYVITNWLASMEQFTISGLLSDTPFGRMLDGPSAFDGSLWTLRYDLAFYALIGVLVGTGVLRRSPRTVLLLAVGCYLLLLRDVIAAPTWTARPPAHGAVGPIPIIGASAADWTLQLGFVFLLGAAARLYAHRIPLHDGLAVAAAVLFVLTFWRGGFFAVGLPAWAYLMLYLGIALPRRLAWLGRGRDYTYGAYIYGFPVQQLLAILGAQQLGLVGYILLSLFGALIFAVPSWHLVEGPAMRFKRRGPGATYRPRHGIRPPLPSAQAPNR
ncbi:acyltransferase [Micromonospora sp. WMMD1102]|nr:acyltransferase [Micromonospora sp. WMMD1102]MDG4786337.1 acyltransferase [Micromonospora sp. WMMD1102]